MKLNEEKIIIFFDRYHDYVLTPSMNNTKIYISDFKCKVFFKTIDSKI